MENTSIFINEDQDLFVRYLNEFLADKESEFLEITSYEFDEQNGGWYALGEGRFGDYIFTFDGDFIEMECTSGEDLEDSHFKQSKSITEILFDVTWEAAYLLHIGLFDDAEWYHDASLYDYCLEIAEDFNAEHPYITDEGGYLDEVVAFTREKLCC